MTHSWVWFMESVATHSAGIFKNFILLLIQSHIDQCAFLSQFQENHSLLECARIIAWALRGFERMHSIMAEKVCWSSWRWVYVAGSLHNSLSFCSFVPILAVSGWTVSQVIHLFHCGFFISSWVIFLKYHCLFFKQWNRDIKKSISLYVTETT